VTVTWAFTGRCFGYVGEQFALVSGRELFLLPDPGAEAIRHIEVRFSLPSGEGARPGIRAGQRLVDLRGSSPAEQMISAHRGLGPFHERTFRLGDTDSPWLSRTDSAVPGRTGCRAAHRRRAIRYAVSLPGPRTLVHDDHRGLPAPSGNEIAAREAQRDKVRPFPAHGQPAPRFRRPLIDAYIRYAPFRTEFGSGGVTGLLTG